MNELFAQAGTVGIIAAISYKSLDLAMQAVQKKFNGRNGNGPDPTVVGELKQLNSQLSVFLREQARHLEVSEQTHDQVKKNEELIDQVNRDVLLMKRDGRE